MSNYPAMTVNQLMAECMKMRGAGFGEKKILISSDDEGNSYHGLFYAFMTKQEDLDVCAEFFEDDVDPKEVVILG